MEASVAPEEIAEAVERGEVEVVRAWLDNGGDANAKCLRGYDADDEASEPMLNRAARYGHIKIMSLLLSKGADIDATDNHGRTAVYELLNLWTQHRSLPALRLLLSHGADVNLGRNTGGILGGRTPLMVCGAHLEIPTSSGYFYALAPTLSIAPVTVIRRKKNIEKGLGMTKCAPEGTPIC